jgi:hypothetical protein
VAFCAALALCAQSAFGGFTEIRQHPSEPNQRQILDHLVGGHFTVDGMGFTNGTVHASRIDDDDDESFAGHKFLAKVVARFSDYSQAFGTFDNGNFARLFDVDGNHYDVNGQAEIDMTRGGAFARGGESSTNSSINSDNADGRDHLLTYKLSGAGHEDQWLLFWEDLNLSPALGKKRTFADYNDLVIQLTADDPPGNLVPLPPAIFSGPAMILVYALVQFARSARRAAH